MGTRDKVDAVKAVKAAKTWLPALAFLASASKPAGTFRLPWASPAAME